jgi:hypothetical protein
MLQRPNRLQRREKKPQNILMLFYNFLQVENKFSDADFQIIINVTHRKIFHRKEIQA